jgi:selenocysteine-specific translation elongation factor
MTIASLQDLHGMIDAAKYADLVLLMVDGGFGFEMETFEFLNLLQVQTATSSSCCISDLCNSAAAILTACKCMVA